MDDAFSLYDAWLLALTFAAAVADARSGLIPNWLTLPRWHSRPWPMPRWLGQGRWAGRWSLRGR